MFGHLYKLYYSQREAFFSVFFHYNDIGIDYLTVFIANKNSFSIIRIWLRCYCNGYTFGVFFWFFMALGYRGSVGITWWCIFPFQPMDCFSCRERVWADRFSHSPPRTPAFWKLRNPKKTRYLENGSW